jgi:hypothetical protein
MSSTRLPKMLILMLAASLINVEIAYSDKDKCFDRCDRLRDKQETVDCYAKCERIYTSDQPRAAEPQDPYDECILLCGTMDKSSQASAARHDACCRACREKYRAEEVRAKRNSEKAARGLADECDRRCSNIISTDRSTELRLRLRCFEQCTGLPPSYDLWGR